MADNVNITPGSGEVVASDQIAGAQYQRVKVTWGADGTANDTSTANPLPITAPSAIPVSASSALPTSIAAAIPASSETGTVFNGGTALTPKFALANIAASTTDGSVVAAVTSKKIRVLAIAVICGATATNITFNTKPAGAGTARTALWANGSNGGFVLPFSPVGWFETASGEGLSATTGAGSTTGVQVTYIEV